MKAAAGDPSARSGRSGRRRKRPLVILALLLGGFALLEGGLRLAAHLTGRERGVTYHPDFGWSCLPNIERRGEFWGRDEPARTNSRGWRDREAALERTPGQRRLVCLGDSFTFGVAVDYGERYTEHLEQDLPDLEAINLGINAVGTDQELRVLEVEGMAYRPDVVLLLAYLGNDLDEIRYERRSSWPKPWYRLEKGELELVPPEPGWDVHLRRASYLGELFLRPFDGALLTSRHAPDWAAQDADTVPLFVALAARMQEVARSGGAEFLAVLVYDRRPADGRRGRRQRRAAAELDAAGVEHLLTEPIFEQALERGEGLYAPDGHWNEEGHRRVARLIAGELRRREWL